MCLLLLPVFPGAEDPDFPGGLHLLLRLLVHSGGGAVPAGGGGVPGGALRLLQGGAGVPAWRLPGPGLLPPPQLPPGLAAVPTGHTGPR